MMLLITLLLGQSAIVVLPEIASAEWTEESRPCDVGPGAILPQPVLRFRVGEPALPPTGYFTYDRPSPPPPSDFTAIANWGDGTTSPAAVEELGVSDCYGVSAPGHTYANTGAYPFSYTVHDSKTGLDHTLGATNLHAWSEIPLLLGGPSSRTINATVGTSWSGVVGEFSDEGTVNPSYPYTAQIEWGDGEHSTSGTISTQGGGNTLAVSGSFTYARPFRGTINVLIWHNAQLLGTWTTSSVDVAGVATPPALRFRGQPILAAIPRAGGAPVYEIVFRVNQPLPQTSSGHVEALLETSGRTSPISHLGAHGTSTCYVARTNGIGQRKPKLGARYPFTLAIDANSVTRDSGQALLREFASLNRMRGAARRQLGCA